MAVTCWDGDMDVTERKHLSREYIVHGAQKCIPVFNHAAFLQNRHLRFLEDITIYFSLSKAAHHQ